MVTVLKIAVAGAVFALTVWFLEPASLWRAAAQVRGLELVICGSFALLGILVQWVKWQQLARSISPELNWTDGLYSLLGGAALGFITPGRLGEIGRGIFLARDRASLTVLAAVDKLSSVIITIGLGLFGALALWPQYRIGLLLALIPFGIGIRWGWKRWGEGGEVVSQVSSWGAVIGWSVLFNLLFMSQFYWLVCGSDSAHLVVILAIPVVFALKALLPVAFMDVGVREAAAVFVFNALNLEAESAFIASTLLFAFNVCLPAAFGGGWIIVRRAMVDKNNEMIRKVAL